MFIIELSLHYLYFFICQNLRIIYLLSLLGPVLYPLVIPCSVSDVLLAAITVFTINIVLAAYNLFSLFYCTLFINTQFQPRNYFKTIFIALEYCEVVLS